jgi:hypothetical protein
MDGAPAKLTREVESPRRTGTGVGVLVVASAAMFFAIAGSAFVLRARMAHVAAHGAIEHAPATAPVVAPAAAPVECGAPQIETLPDGRQVVLFEPCAKATAVVVDGEVQIATPLPESLGLRVP